tara:strand:- start:73 stop:462 length:390 start_codon:yes stop_codon:yes gene_type:complete
MSEQLEHFNVKRIIYLNLIILLVFSCEKESIIVVETSSLNFITSTGAVCGGEIVELEYGIDIVEKGVCWSKYINPTIEENLFTEDGYGAWSYMSYITDLEHYQTYYVRAYAINSTGRFYGQTLVFTTKP